ncbi:MICAL-like protein 1 isoform X2 [Leptopilina heterotoma]|uniref:MICAL-like protein 1 isoform X2 n=1 Tax=Leptopilina heterotoma TaxID=63436 RepID=UPI001CA81599|nr:MICAL-like protein 1 isoform X2 [Leptopilina heterotoma]
MGERRGTKALELWCRRITDGYPGVNVQNMTTSWRDGLAFCAMIHHFRPDLIDFDSLNKDDIYGNNELAFRIAEQHLGIPALLDAEDMASCAVPDRLSILTYLSQFYQSFGVSSPTRLALNRTTESSSERIAPVPESPKPKMGSRLGMRRDPCAVCGLPVFLAEKLVISRMHYHRTCFRCARCKNQLTPGNYYETEDGQYCCETCPDEEALAYNNEATCFSSPTTANDDILQKSLSDEEKIVKSIDPKILQTPQTASTPNNNNNNNTDDDSNDISSYSSSAQQLRLKFIESNLIAEKLSIFNDDIVSLDDELSAAPNSSALRRLMMSDAENSDPVINDDNDQRLTAISSHDVDFKCLDDKTNTKDLDGEAATASLVQQRLKMFESQDKKLKVVNTVKPALSKKDLTSFFPPTNQEENNEIESDENDGNDGNDSPIFESKKPSEKFNPRETKLKRMDTLEAEFERLLESNSIESEQVFLNETEESNIFNPPETELELKPELKLEQKDTIQSQEREIEKKEKVEIDKNYSRSQLETDELNLFTAKGINLSDVQVDNYPQDLNPFADEEEEEVEEEEIVNESKKNTSKISTNPFGSSDDEEEMKIQETRIKRRLKAPEISLNPFSSEDDDDDDEYNNDNNTKGKNIERDKNVPINFPVPKPRTINLITSKQNLERSGMYASNTSLASCGSTPGASSRKKKPAPQPPTKEILSSPHSNPTTPKRNSSINTTNSSPHMTPRMRKSKPAPPPPILTSTPQNESLLSHINCNESPIQELISDDDLCKLNMWEDQKSNKDEVNRTRQSLSCHDSQSYASYADKSVQGKWKRKKGPAPPRPVPLRRKIKVLSMKDIKLELDQIELQQQGLERQGVRLEQIIRDKSESKPNGEDSNLDGDVEELVLELFVLVNEKNELFRRQAELMLLRRQQRLEEEHADVEYQIRCLMCQPEATKTDFDKQREETLIQRLVQIVERRNEIVECLEMDRKREVEEDRSINKHMGLYAGKFRK